VTSFRRRTPPLADGAVFGPLSFEEPDYELDPGFASIPDGDGATVEDPAPADFTPDGDSPLREAGYGGDADIVLPTTDFFGAARDDTPTIGAIE
jgi:hypothetical protein